MNNLSTEDLRVFIEVARRASFAAAAKALDSSTAYISKRVRILETLLQTQLLHRSTRHVAVTEEGERVYVWAQRILGELDGMLHDVSMHRQAPQGLLRVCSSFGFGRRVVAPLIAKLAKQYPGLSVRFEVFDRLIDIQADGFDLDVRVGDSIAPQLVAKRLATNYRILCAAPDYLERREGPRSISELSRHDCLVIRERDHPFGLWELRNGTQNERIKVTGPLSSNQGEIVVQWCLDGQGIALRSMWDVGEHLQTGRLVQVLPEWTQEANIYAVYPPHTHASTKTRACVDFLAAHLPKAIGLN